MSHLYHGYVSHNQRVVRIDLSYLEYNELVCWAKFITSCAKYYRIYDNYSCRILANHLVQL